MLSYALRSYVWRTYRIYVDVQALQFSLFGGRCFFKGFRYHGHNETILVNDGFITWRYWLRRVSETECLLPKSFSPLEEDRGENGQNVSAGKSRVGLASHLPCRIAVEVRGVEWFVYNRSQAYETILKSLSDEKFGVKTNETQYSKDVPAAELNEPMKDGLDHFQSTPKEEIREELEQKASSFLTSDSSASESSARTLDQKASLPTILTVLPVRIECSRGAVIMGNQNTRSVLTAKFDRAEGFVDARHSRPLDSYKQCFDLDFIQPVVEMKPNRDYKESQLATGSQNKAKPSEDSHTKQQPGSVTSVHKAPEKARSFILQIIGLVQKGFASLFEQKSKEKPNGKSDTDEFPGQNQWLGLTRYLDDEDDLIEQERWKAIEYGQHSRIFETPRLSMSLYWDVPGMVGNILGNGNTLPEGLAENINHTSPPDWAIELRMHGGLISYGPWADRLRADLQSVFFPASYRDATPAAMLSPGQTRVSTTFKMLVEFEKETTVMIPTRESSKDWRWKDSRNAAAKNENKKQDKKGRMKKAKEDAATDLRNIRPYGWLDMKIQPDSALTFITDLVAGGHGYTTRLDLDIKEPMMSSSVNHGVLLRSTAAVISCDLSNPLCWNSIREWHVDCHASDLEVFLLRDHMFLLIDLIDDWTSGPQNSYHTFVPFTYMLKFQLTNFKLFLNVNDHNIINNPSDVEENTFVVLWAEHLIALLEIPLKTFRPTRGRTSFDVDVREGGLKLLTPPWNTQHVFLDRTDVASFKNFRLDGCYDHSTTTALGQTDNLVLNIHGIEPKVQLYGFLIRYFLKIKDNYFGDDIHFRTLEEHQGASSRKGSLTEAPVIGKKPTKITNDLDVILSITAVSASALLPCLLYSPSENITLDLPSLGVDLRFTNYYMDLLVAFSPIAASLGYSLASEPPNANRNTATQLFIDGLEIFGHRLFGLPPTEPTYVCNWDFSIGSIIGECSIQFVKNLSLALNCFAFAFDDAENTLPLAPSVQLHDVTFLRVKIQLIRVWLRLDEAAILLATQECKIIYNDLARILFSERLHVNLQDVILALTDAGDSLVDRGGEQTSGQTHGSLRGNIRLDMVHRKKDFEKDRQLQQNHLRSQDLRTNRTPWLLIEGAQPFLGSTDHKASVRAPFMPFPPMPEPLLRTNVSMEDQETMSSSNTLHSDSTAQSRRLNSFLIRTSSRGKDDARARSGRSPPKTIDNQYSSANSRPQASRTPDTDSYINQHDVQHKVGGNVLRESSNTGKRNTRTGFGFSSPYKRPHFTLQAIDPDLGSMPSIPNNIPLEEAARDVLNLGNGETVSHEEGCVRSSLIVDFEKGLQAFGDMQAFSLTTVLIERLQITDPVSLLDQMQIGALKKMLKISEQHHDGHSKLVEARIRVPHLEAKFVHREKTTPFHQVTFSLSLQKLLTTLRLHKRPDGSSEQAVRQEISAHVSLNRSSCTAQSSNGQLSSNKTTLTATIHDLTAWMQKAAQLTVDARCYNIEIVGALGNAEYLIFLHRHLSDLSEHLKQFVDVFERQRSRLRNLVLSLASEGEGLPDPRFLTRASHLLRSANSHLRSSDSWRIASRLRYVYQCLPEHRRAWLYSQCLKEPTLDGRDLKTQFEATFDRFGVWDVSQAKQSVLMQEIFGSWLESREKGKAMTPFRGSFRTEGLRLILQPGAHHNEIALGMLVIGVVASQDSMPIASLLQFNTKLSVQIYLAQTTMVMRWSIFEILKDAIQALAVASSSPNIGGSRKVVPIAQSENAFTMHTVISSDMTTIALESPNFRATYLCQGLKGSLLRSRSKNFQNEATSLLVTADAAKTELQSQNRALIRSRLTLPSIFGNLDGAAAVEAIPNWHFAASSTNTSLEILEEPLVLVHAADLFLGAELQDVQELLHAFKSVTNTDKASTTSSIQNILGRPHVALFLDSYLVTCMILPALSYQVKGQVARLSMQPRNLFGSTMILNFDLKDHAHTFLGHVLNTVDPISILQIPPINGRFVLDLGSTQKSVVFHTTVEQTALDAAAVHSLLTTVSRPEIGRLASRLKRDLSHVWRKTTRLPKSTWEEPKELNEPLLYDAYVTLAGLSIHTKTSSNVSQAEASRLHFELGCVFVKSTNKDSDQGPAMRFPEFQIILHGARADLSIILGHEIFPCGDVSVGANLRSTSKYNESSELVRAHQAQSSKFKANMYPKTASVVIDIINHLQESLKSIDLTNEVRGLKMLRRATMPENVIKSKPKEIDNATAAKPLFNAMYSLELADIRVSWKTGNSVPLSPGREAEDLVLSITKVDLSTRRDNAARLLIQDFQLQIVGSSRPLQDHRSPNSALLPEVVFNVAYMTTASERRLAFQAVGKSLDLRLTSQFMLPTNDLRRSIAVASDELRTATKAWKAYPTKPGIQAQSWAGHKRLTSLLIDADFAGAVVHLQGRTTTDPQSFAHNVLRGSRMPQQGRYGQFKHNDAGSNNTLRAPGIALKVEFKDVGNKEKSLNAEIKVDASSNTLYPTMVPLVMEISSSVKEVVGESDAPEAGMESRLSPPSFLKDERLRNSNPSTILNNCKLNVGLRICRQEFSLSCQPIARVSATAHFDDIYVTVNTVQSTDHSQFFTLSASFTGLQASVQHVYSRESTGNLNLDSIVVSMMNSKHLGAGNGISAIVRATPMKVQINGRQMQDFLLFQEIWLPADIRKSASSPIPSPSSEPQAFILQRYQQVASTGAFPWNATIIIAEIDVRLDLGQSLGKSAFVISDCWVSTKKSSDSEQNLCLGFKTAGIESTGRMSGIIQLQEVKVRTSIRWHIQGEIQSQTPLIQASIGIDLFRVKASFDYQAFAIGETTAFKFLMYNVREHRTAVGDRLIAFVDAGNVRAFCTTASASQGLALCQAIERLVQEKEMAYKSSLKDIEKFLRRKSTANPQLLRATSRQESQKADLGSRSPSRLQTKVVVSLKTVNVGAFPSTFLDNQIFKLEALDVSAQFAIRVDNERLHSILGMDLGQLRIALSSVSRPSVPKTLGEVAIDEVISAVSSSRGGTILKVPKVVASMQTWQFQDSTEIDYIFKSSFQGKVDVGWNYSRISFLRGMWNNHSRALAQRLGKPLPQAAVQITTDVAADGGNSKTPGTGQERITAVVNVPQSKYRYTALEPPIIETPQLRDMGEATPPLEWIGLHRERLPNLTHQIIIVALVEVAREVEDAYSRILGAS